MNCEYCDKPNLFNCLIKHKNEIPTSCMKIHRELSR